MPTISSSISVAANSRSANVLAGSPFEFVSQPSIIKLATTQAGAASSDINANFQIGGESLMVDGNIANKAAMPTFRDDLIAEAGAQDGERLFLTFSNTTVGALVVQFILDIMPI